MSNTEHTEPKAEPKPAENSAENNRSSRLKLFIPLVIFIVLAGFLFRGLSLDPKHLPSALVDKTLPPFNLPTLAASVEDSALVTPADLKGEPFLLNFWATWCPTCVVEHPYLLKLAEQGVKIIGVNYKDEDDKARHWLQKRGDPFAVNIVDKDGRLGLDMGVYGAPETFVVDSEGVVRYRHVGEVNHKVWTEILAPLMINNAATK